MANNPSKIMTGARALIYVGGKQIGFFSSCEWSYQLRVEPAYILGRYSVAELTYTDAEVVTVRCAGFRPFDGKENYGPHQTLSGASKLVPTLADLAGADSVDIVIVDRQSNKAVMQVQEARCTGYNTSLRAREQQTISMDFMGKRVSAEGAENVVEGGNVATFPGNV
jgi:hypothetical protein